MTDIVDRPFDTSNVGNFARLEGALGHSAARAAVEGPHIDCHAGRFRRPDPDHRTERCPECPFHCRTAQGCLL